MINFTHALYLADLDASKHVRLSLEHRKFWQMARDYVVGGENINADLISKTVEGPVSLLILVGVISVSLTLLYQTGFKTAKDGPFSVVTHAAPQFFWVVVVTFLLLNQFANAYKIANTTWQFRTLMRDRTETVVFANSVISRAIAQEVFNAQFGQETTEQLAECQAMPLPTVRVPSATRPPIGAEVLPTLEENQTYDFLDCMKTLKTRVEDNYKYLQRTCGENLESCQIVEEKGAALTKQVSDGVDRITGIYVTAEGEPFQPWDYTGTGRFLDEYTSGNLLAEIGDVISSALSSIGDFAYIKLVELGNTLYTASIELMFLLGGLFFPITVAWSLIPGKRQVMLDWLVFTLSLIISEQIYLILIGVVAALSQQPQFYEFGPRLFLITLGILGPLLAMGGGAVSGYLMARTYRGASIGAVGAVGSIASAAIFTAVYRIHHRHQLRRA